MLADFAVRLAFGLALSLLMTSWRAVPLRFFQIQNHVMLGLLVLAALDQARTGDAGPRFWLVVAGAVLAYVATVGWGLGLPKIGVAADAVAALVTSGWMIAASRSDQAGLWMLNALSRIASGFVMGATLSAMLLGHHYLTAPSMTIAPLKRVVALIAGGLGARCLLAGIGLFFARSAALGLATASSAAGPEMLLAARWGMGFAGAAVSVYLTWRTVQIRSTQSATGILYITTIFVLFGELTSLILARQGGVIC